MIILEGTDAVGKTSTIRELKKENIICEDRSKEMISKYMLAEYDIAFRAKKYQEYLKKQECFIIFLTNSDKEELLRRVHQRTKISDFDLQAPEYNQMYQDTFDYMEENNMREGKLFLVDVTGLSLEEQVQKVKQKILSLKSQSKSMKRL